MSVSPKTANELITSARAIKGVHTIHEILDWITKENRRVKAILNKTSITKDSFWFYDDEKSVIRNRNNSFFSLSGIKTANKEQPIILQNEVGYLGFIGKKINGIIHFLMQAKIEPGNVNNVQISPTIQATKSNFTQKHGGRAPHYLEYFKETDRYNVIYDGDEPEQCSRFLRKYNRNVILLLQDDDEIDVLPGFKWMTIGQIKRIAIFYNNLVNMDTRTVLSCIPYDLADPLSGSALINSVFGEDSSDSLITAIKARQGKIQRPELIRLDELHDWTLSPDGIFSKKPYPFHFEYFDIAIENREVTHWTQPLAVANGKALFALAYIIEDNIMYFAIKTHEEIGCDFGSCFGPTIQFEAPFVGKSFKNALEREVYRRMKENKCFIRTILSEEGGRFYHEENENVICEVSFSKSQMESLGYFVVTYKTIRQLIEKTHMVNIQLRNLLSLLV